MNKTRLTFFIGLVLIFLQVSCSKKVAPVSGSAGLDEGGRSQVMDEAPNALGNDAVREQDALAGFDDGLRGMQSLEEQSPQEREKQELEVRDTSLTEVMNRLQDVFFEYDKAVLHRASKEALQENARNLILHPTAQVQIEGHTDARGNNEYNLALGARRARAVKRFLEALGVESSRMKIISFGEEKPACRINTERCWKQNRRAHFMSQPQG